MPAPKNGILGIRHALRVPGSLPVDLLVVAGVVSLVGGLLAYGAQFSAPFHEKVSIDLSWKALPLYTFFSLCRGFAAYAVSLAFTLVYATVAERNPRAGKIMIPVLDVLQSIPVLGFLPGLVLAMIAIFPTRESGLEVACIVMIFTAQAWNMTFSYYASLKNIPTPLREAAAVFRLPRGRVFRLLELPASMIGLVWNSMMSMAGGWFFLSVNEAFKLGDRDFRLPGVGSYMAEAIEKGDRSAQIAAIVAMTVMIVGVDQLFWRPVVVWAERFKLEDTAEAEKPRSWFLELLENSRLTHLMNAWRRRLVDRVHIGNPVEVLKSVVRPKSATPTQDAFVAGIVRWVFIAAGAGVTLWGGWSVVRLLIHLPVRADSGGDWLHVLLAVGATFLRTSAALLLGTLWCLPAGVMIGLSAKWSQRLQPVVQFAASFPAPMLFPWVVMLLATAGVPFSSGCVVLMVVGSQWYILFNVIAGAMAIPGDLKEVGRVMGTTRAKTWARLYLPCVFPYLVTGLVTAAGGAWNASIVSEYVTVKSGTLTAFGLGSLISEATANADYPLLAASIVTMAVTVVVINRLFWKRLFRVAETRFSLNT